MAAFVRSSFASAATTSSHILSSSLQFHKHVRSITINKTITQFSKCKLTNCSKDVDDIEKRSVVSTSSQKKNSWVNDSLLHRFRKKRALSVTDLTASEWCEKQMEFSLLFGKPERTVAMKVGSDRHASLKEEVVKKVKIEVKSKEDVWALKFMNFIVGANQLVFNGLTRELPLIGIAEGVWITGVIDEIRMPTIEGTDRFPTLVDTKTRVQATLPTKPQQRNGRLQLMCYKHLWDNLVADKFPSGQFCDFFSLNCGSILCTEIRENTAKLGFPAETLDDLVRYYKNTWCTLPPANNQLILRYELQEDQSFIGEDQFAYDPDWLQYQIKNSLEFWKGERGANYTRREERWKCKSCKFKPRCRATDNGESS